MLQTCTRCRSRRIKCDSLLPACANCAKNDLECTFRDDALQEDIPRSYIKSLNDRIRELNSHIALRSNQSSSGTLDHKATAISSSKVSRPFQVVVPGHGKDIYLDLSLAPCITEITFEVLSSAPGMHDILNGDEGDSLQPELSQVDRSMLTPSVVRFLLGRYDRCIRPRYDVVEEEILHHDGMNVKKLPDSQKFQILMICAIAAACESYKSPNWKPFAHTCRAWANELIIPIISSTDGNSLAATLLLLVYELADPGRGIIWDLLDLAIRTCLQLGWHRTAQASKDSLCTLSGTRPGKGGISDPTEVRLMFVLRDIETSLRTTFNRPTMLSSSGSPTTYNNETILLYEQLFHAIYDKDHIYDTQSCPFIGEVSTLMDVLNTYQRQDPTINEAWLLFLPVCVRHKQCVFCFQEEDESISRGMRTLREKVINAAFQLLRDTHKDAVAHNKFISPIIASSRALVSGCSIVTGISKRWITSQSHMRDLIRCTDVLSLFAPHWKGGHNYIRVWRTIVDLLDTTLE